jgi:peroxiredoxin
VPADDGACDGLPGTAIPHLVLPSSQGPVDLAEFARERLVLYVYPRAGRPGVPLLPGWDAIPGARGCTPQSCAFRDHAAELAGFGARVAGLSAQSLDDQIEFAERNHMPFPVVSDADLELRDALGLPTFVIEGLTLYKRVTIVAERGSVVKVFYPVFPPDRNAEEVMAWLSHGV